MKKVLIIGYFWPYIRYGGGRIIELVNYLHDFGWYPIVLTVPLSQKIKDDRFKVIEVPFKGDIFQFWRKIVIRVFKVNTKRRISDQVKEKFGVSSQKSYLDFIFNIYQEIFGYPDTEKGWKIPALRRAKEIIEGEQIDAIISTYPIISHIIAKELKKIYRIPWIVDFPDLWSQNHDYPYGRIRRYFDKKLEINTLKWADAIVTVSQPWADKLKLIHKNEKIYTITHAFDPKIINHPPAPLSEKFTITYTGKIYVEMQDPEPFLVAIRELILEKIMDSGKLEIRFYGDKELWLQKLIEKYNLTPIVPLYDRLPKNLIVEKQRESQLLLLFDPNNEMEKGCYTLKLYDYLAARRPIIIVGGTDDDVLWKLVSETRVGLAGKTTKGIKNILKKFYMEYIQHGGVVYRGIIERVDIYNYLEIAKRSADILNQITKK